MRYLKNNGEPRPLTVSEQRIIKHWDVDANEISIRVIMWRHTGGKTENLAEENKEARDMFLPKTKKAFIYEKNGQYLGKEGEKIVDVGYSERIISYPHIINIPCGTSRRDERRYTIKVGEIVEIENPEDVEHLLGMYHFIDEVDEKGVPVEVPHLTVPELMVKGNPYRPPHSQRADWRNAPRRFEEVGENAAPRSSPIGERVKEISPASAEEAQFLELNK